MTTLTYPTAEEIAFEQNILDISEARAEAIFEAVAAFRSPDEVVVCAGDWNRPAFYSEDAEYRVELRLDPSRIPSRAEANAGIRKAIDEVLRQRAEGE
jgi:hypothetical protein